MFRINAECLRDTINYFAWAADTTEVVDEFVCTAPDELAEAAFDDGDDWVTVVEDGVLMFVFAFVVGLGATFNTAAETIGGDLPRLDERFA